MKKKEYKIKGYMTFRDGKPLGESSLSICSYRIYLDKAPIRQTGDKSVEVVIIYKN